jgi:hypothetical protein
LIQTVSEVKNPDTAELERSWVNAITSKCNLVKQVEDIFSDEHEISRARFRLMVPPETQVNGETLSIEDHRIGDITLYDESVEPGPFKVIEVLSRRGRHRNPRFLTLMIERVKQDEN